MYWSDKLALELKKRNLPLEWVDDMKTPSGRVHVGALIGVAVHGLIYESLKKAKVNTKYTYVFENHDPMDDIPSYLPREKYEQYLGMPLYKVPSPQKGYKNFAEYYALEFQQAFNAIGFFPEILWTKDLYTSSKMNHGIKLVLDNSQEVRNIYQEMYKKDIASDWYPFQVYCEKCGKVSTTQVYNWDGEYVHYRCMENLVKWTRGCNNTGAVSPFSDEHHLAGKMPWKVEWSVKWQAIGVTVEGAGKDHMSSGGSHDLTSLIAKRVLKYSVPYPIPYEWMLIGGRKMSSSKGVGFAAGDMLEILPPTLLRFLLVKMNIKQQMNFDPTDHDTIPKLFDQYQEYARHFFEEKNDDEARIFELSQIGKLERPPLRVRFSTLAQWVQMPNMQDKIIDEGLTEWAKYAKLWVEKFAPESERFFVQENVPDSAIELSDEQKDYLLKITNLLDIDQSAQEFQLALYSLSKEMKIASKDAFAAIYISLIGKTSGPKAAWLILSLDKNFIQERFREVAKIINT